MLQFPGIPGRAQAAHERQRGRVYHHRRLGTAACSLSKSPRRPAGPPHVQRVKIILDNIPVMFYVSTRWFWKEGSELLTYQDCQNHEQRPRVFVKVTEASGSRGCVPGVLRHLLPLCCSNPRRGSVSLPYWWEAASLPVRLCECMPWTVAGVKSAGPNNVSEMPAKIAVFHAKASGHCANTQYNTYRSNGLGAGAETTPPFFFPHAMPP